MGVGIFDHYRSDNRIPINSIQTIIERVEVEKKAKNPNPDPYNWIINDTFINGSWDKNIYLLIDITYPDCTNYEGRKIMLYENVLKKNNQEQHFFHQFHYKIFQNHFYILIKIQLVIHLEHRPYDLE